MLVPTAMLVDLSLGLYMWMIFHEDFCYSIHGEEVGSVKEAQVRAQVWIGANAKPIKAAMPIS